LLILIKNQEGRVCTLPLQSDNRCVTQLKRAIYVLKKTPNTTKIFLVAAGFSLRRTGGTPVPPKAF
jgi:hypothetical protein